MPVDPRQVAQDATIERMAKALHDAESAYYETVDKLPVEQDSPEELAMYKAMARAALAALVTPDSMEAAKTRCAELVSAHFLAPSYRPLIKRMTHATQIALEDTAHLLVAPYVQEIERLQKERDDSSWIGEVLSMVDGALKAHGIDTAPMFYDDAIHRAFSKLAAAEARVERMRSSLRTIAQLLQNPADAGHLINGGNAFKLARDTYIAETDTP